MTATVDLSELAADATRAAVTDPDRLAELRASELLDSPPEEAFDRITRLAERLLDVPVALISLVDRERQYFKSHVGLTGSWAQDRQSPLTHSFCQYAVATKEQFVVDDALRSPLVGDNPAITEEGVAAYAGSPLETSAGHALGALCVIDHQARQWQPWELDLLDELSALAVTEIEYRLRTRALREIESQSRALEEPVAQLGDALRSMVGVAERVEDPRVARLTALARLRLSAVEAAASELASSVARNPLHAEPGHEAIMLGDRVMRAARAAAAAVPGKSISINVRDRPLRVACDPYEIERSLISVIVSVMQHAGSDEPVDATLSRDAGSARLCIRSGGQAMPVSELVRSVSQITAATCDLPGDVEEGSLTTSGGVTTAENGPVRATTGPTGTTFTMTLPLVEATA